MDIQNFPSLAAAIIDGSIRVLYNSNKEIFNEIFGPRMGLYLWHKFVDDKQASEGSFICYLDYENQLKLAKYVLKYIAENDIRAKVLLQNDDKK